MATSQGETIWGRRTSFKKSRQILYIQQKPLPHRAWAKRKKIDFALYETLLCGALVVAVGPIFSTELFSLYVSFSLGLYRVVISLFLKIQVSEIVTLSEKTSVDYLIKGFLALGLLLLVYVLARRQDLI